MNWWAITMPYELLNWKPKLPPITTTWQEMEKILKELEGEDNGKTEKP